MNEDNRRRNWRSIEDFERDYSEKAAKAAERRKTAPAELWGVDTRQFSGPKWEPPWKDYREPTGDDDKTPTERAREYALGEMTSIIQTTQRRVGIERRNGFVIALPDSHLTDSDYDEIKAACEKPRSWILPGTKEPVWGRIVIEATEQAEQGTAAAEAATPEQQVPALAPLRPATTPGPKKGKSGRHIEADRRLFHDIGQLMNEEGCGPYEAARRFIDRIAGAEQADDESRIRRVAKRFKKETKKDNNGRWTFNDGRSIK